MTLYEISTGYTGCSYVRAYAWAPSESEALRLFKERNPKSQGEPAVTPIFSADAAPFCSIESDEGFDL